ncbi:MAG: PilZ domain-containing protein [Chloroflexota bacterium]|nr:PilZ domain-containing protein [Chloroflexota bacterium]MBI5701936.1 PilZ domain-containing protein [Chloroflexota bacterium]
MEEIRVGERVEIHLDAKFGKHEGWYAGTVVRIEPYSKHRSFYWVELDEQAQAALNAGMKLISVFNPKNIRKVKSF